LIKGKKGKGGETGLLLSRRSPHRGRGEKKKRGLKRGTTSMMSFWRVEKEGRKKGGDKGREGRGSLGGEKGKGNFRPPDLAGT